MALPLIPQPINIVFSFLRKNNFDKLNAFHIHMLFSLAEIFNTHRTFHSLLLHILDSDRAKWFMVCNKYTFLHVLLPNILLTSFSILVVLFYVAVSLTGLYELRVKLFLLILIILIMTLWMTFFLVIGLYIFFSSLQFFCYSFHQVSLSWVFLLFCLFSLFWDVVANAVGVAGSLFISPGPFSTFQSEPRIY